MAVQNTVHDGASAVPATRTSESEKNRNLIQRLVTALIGIPISVGFIVMGGWYFAAFIALVCLLTTLELCGMAIVPGPLRWVAAVGAIAFPFLFVSKSLGPQYGHWLWAGVTVVALTVRMLLGAPLERAANDVMVTVFAAIYGALAGYLVPLREAGGPGFSWSGSGWVILVCSLSWLSDTGAYFAGRFFGRHKLAPDISPSKTWEGFVGGVVAAIGAGFLTKVIVLHALTPWDCVAVGLISGVTGPLGDLSESMLKRSFHVKDSGQLLPGHGGMMDRVDALVFNALAMYAYYYLVFAGRMPLPGSA